MSINDIQRRLLDAIEERELRALVWGYVDGSLSRAETIALAPGRDEDLVEDLIDRCLLFEREGRIRSRFAETVRLLVRSRQIFKSEQWRSAPRLVADFRIDRRPRLFPQRDVPAADVWNGIPPAYRDDSLRRAAWDALTCDERGGPMELARFQQRSIERLLRDDADGTATIVTAGTGSGKTFCFYLPALVEVAAQVAQGTTHTLALAVYPRKELLKDQLREALRLAAKIRPVLEARGKRHLRIGVFYGDIPYNWRVIEKYPAWKPTANGDGYVCPFVRCPTCEGDLTWYRSDAEQARTIERLRCSRPECDDIDEVVLTRDALRAAGCDVLFITSESLNQRLADRTMRPILGLDQPFALRPRFVLLDEVHTYAGTSRRPGGPHTAPLASRGRSFAALGRAVCNPA